MHKNITIINYDCVSDAPNCGITLVTIVTNASKVVNYNNMFIIQATVTAVINYDRSLLIVQASVTTVINYDRNSLIVQAH
jgi:hypothetical protein